MSKKADEGLATCKDIANFFKKRAATEDEYAKGLSQLVKSTAGEGMGNKVLRRKGVGKKESGYAHVA